MKVLKRIFQCPKPDPLVSVIRLAVIIVSACNYNRCLNLKSVEANIETAYEQKNASAVALIINSPGWSPVQADLIQKRIRDLADEKDKILIHVIDNGKGIPKQFVNRIFQPGVTTKKRGWGLGLSLCRRIIEDYHQGSIQVRSTAENKGTHFEIALKR